MQKNPTEQREVEEAHDRLIGPIRALYAGDGGVTTHEAYEKAHRDLADALKTANELNYRATQLALYKIVTELNIRPDVFQGILLMQWSTVIS
ncbi:hypothetical protein M0P48_00175 [Candidatus Gracilibacteria bacterium]|jgi:hypothetical protein|nr:hypothetical protein [Candidatus Gracilibacteria bacterium]